MSQPFEHDELPVKQHFLQLARDNNAKSDTVENELASALLYMNVADYVAEYLVKGFAEMTKVAMNKYYLGMVTVIPHQRDGFNIGNAIHALQGYDFPKKAPIMAELNAINLSRKKIAHEILKTKSTELEDVDKAVRDLVEHTEALVVLVDEIDPGLPPMNLLDKLQAAGIEPDEIETEEAVPNKRKPTTTSAKKQMKKGKT